MSDATLAPRSQPAKRFTGRSLRWRRVRMLVGWLGLVALAALTAIGASPVGNAIGTAALGALALAAIAALFEARGLNAPVTLSSGVVRQRGWPVAYAVCAIVPALAVQSWFAPGGAVAGGDISPPAGTAWIGRLFEPWQWSGSNLGGPAEPVGAVWAAVLGLVHALGGPAALAQQLWFTLLLAGAAVAALTLLRQLGAQPLGAGAGALVYVFNPFVLSVVGTNAVYIAAMVLLAALPASLLAVGRGTLRLRWSVSLWVLSAPLLAYAYANPPLILLIAAACMLTPMLAWERFGAAGARHAAYALGLGVVAAGFACAFWLVPAAIVQRTVAAASLSAPSSWLWTEGRATIPNALWLNTGWGWKYPAYYPFAHVYDRVPLVIAKYALPVLAFSALLVLSRSQRTLRLVAWCALGALAVAFISTGTRPPGSVAFNALYNLPFGWLLREPGRFLMGSALLYAVLVSFAVNGVLRRVWSAGASRGGRALGRVALLLAAVAIAAAAFPLYTGALVPGPRPGFPSNHVRIPAYWLRMASWVNRSAPPGRLLMLPVDDFYQMPYTWYYGNDGFITDLIGRPVLDPSGQGYTTVSTTLQDTTALVSASIVRHDWASAERALHALGTPLVLVRGDIRANFPGRSIVAPARLGAALARDPDARLLRREGPLQLWSLDPPLVRHAAVTYATVNTTNPDLRALSLLPRNAWLVTSHPLAGHVSVTEPPAPSEWLHVGNELRTAVPAPSGWEYSVARLTDTGVGRLTAVGATRRTLGGGLTAARVEFRQGPAVVLERRLRKPLLANGNFARGLWEPVGNCNDTAGAPARPLLHASVLPNGGPSAGRALRLSAGIDSACEAHALSWRRGSFYLSLSVRHLAGAPARICVWESGINRCLSTLPPLPSGRGWQSYHALVTPARGTTSVLIFLYADSLAAGQHTVDEYADLAAYALPRGGAARPVVLGKPRHFQAGQRLTVNAESYSGLWTAPGHHVLVDGLRNGWLADAAVTPRYGPVAVVEAADWVSGATGAIVLGMVVLAAAAALRRWLLAGPHQNPVTATSMAARKLSRRVAAAGGALAADVTEGRARMRGYAQDTRVTVAAAILCGALLAAGGAAYLLGRGSGARHVDTAPIQTIVIQRRQPAAPSAAGRALRAPARVALVALQRPALIEVREGSAGGRVLFTGLVRPGRPLRFDRPLLWLRIRAGGAVRITVNGRLRRLPVGAQQLLVSSRGVRSAGA